MPKNTEKQLDTSNQSVNQPLDTSEFTEQEQYALAVLDMPLIAINQIPDQLNLHYDIGSAKAHQIAILALKKLKAQLSKCQKSEEAIREQEDGRILDMGWSKFLKDRERKLDAKCFPRKSPEEK